MAIDWSIKVGDILTSLAIVVSASALVYSWTKDREARNTELADNIRQEAAYALTNLDRWVHLNESLYQNVQPIFITTSEMIKGDDNIIEERDYLWKSINEQRNIIKSKILDEKILTSYIGLLAHFPQMRGRYVVMFESLTELEEDISNRLLEETQDDVLSQEDSIENYTSAVLGNALRTTAESHRDRLLRESARITTPLRDSLFEIIGKPNQEILRSGHLDGETGLSSLGLLSAERT